MREARDRIALATGAGSGLGRAFVHELGLAGFSVAAMGRREDALAATLAALPTDRGMRLVADVTDENAVQRSVDAVTERWGRIDLLVNNAGTFGDIASFDALPVSAFRDVIEVNLMGAIICSHAVLPIMKSQRSGRIINNGSLSARVPRPLSAPYAISKHALTGLTRCLALEGREHGISAGQIDIGNAETEMTAFASSAIQPDGTRANEPRIRVQDAARALRYMATLPEDATVLEMTLLATGMPFVGRG